MRGLVLVLLAFLFATGCDLNPQPEVPGSTEPEAAGGAAGAAGAGAGVEVPGAAEDDPGRADTDPTDYSGGLQAGKAARPDAGGLREVPDAGAEAAPGLPPVVAR